MTEKISRRDLLKATAAASAASLIPAGVIAAEERPGIATGGPDVSAGAENAAHTAADPRIQPLNCNSGVYIPPRGRSFFKFGFDFPEPSVPFADLLFSFRVYTFENTYALDPSLMRIADQPDGMEIRCSGFTWAGDQEKAPGRLLARLRKNGNFVEWDVSARMDKPIKSIATILRWVPRGPMSVACGNFTDPRDNEISISHPYLRGGMTTPLVVIKKDEQNFFFLSSLSTQVRGTRFYFEPGDQGYRTELGYEQAGWEQSNSIQTPAWRVGTAKSYEEAARPHFEHLEQAFKIGDWKTRTDVPQWMREVALVVSIHGAHWCGYVYNDFAKMQRTLEWVATQIPGNRVLVFLPAWDGRYYWNYPIFKVAPRLGGEAAFRTLIDKGHSLGFHMMPMYGANAANRKLPVFPNFANATTRKIDGDAFDLNWGVDMDNDRSADGWGSFMNLGVDSWRNWMYGRISDMIERFKVDAYFLDIVGGWMNNLGGDMYEGTARLVGDLRAKYPHVLAVGEMHYDALMSCIPLYQVPSAPAYPAGFWKYCSSFLHLSHPAPGRGSTGVHEDGFGRFSPELPRDGRTIPTITVVDDTFDKYRDAMATYIAASKAQAGIA